MEALNMILRVEAALTTLDRQRAMYNAEHIGGIYKSTERALLVAFVREVREALTPVLELSGEELLSEHGHPGYDTDNAYRGVSK